jgi:ParB family chromosome partitioning protein
MEKRALGRGLDALLPTNPAKRPISDAQDIQFLATDQIRPNPFQPRTDFATDELAQLAESVRKNGLLQPVVVRKKGDGSFELIAGERRLRASKLAGLDRIPAVIRNSNDEQAMELALVENLQRADLNPMESARAYHRMVSEFGLTQDDVAQRVGKDRSSISNMLRLMQLPTQVQGLVESGQLSTGHAKAILGLPTPEGQLVFAQQIVEKHLSVRETERIVIQRSAGRRPLKHVSTTSPFAMLEDQLKRRYGTKVTVMPSREGGRVVFEYYSEEELSRLADILLG